MEASPSAEPSAPCLKTTGPREIEAAALELEDSRRLAYNDRPPRDGVEPGGSDICFEGAACKGVCDSTSDRRE